jgi:hypothetical protein
VRVLWVGCARGVDVVKVKETVKTRVLTGAVVADVSVTVAKC